MNSNLILTEINNTIGGMRKAEGWLNVNAQNKNYKYTNAVDILREMHDLKGLPNNSVSAIYCR